MTHFDRYSQHSRAGQPADAHFGAAFRPCTALGKTQIADLIRITSLTHF
jgi:hypothetical protein